MYPLQLSQARVYQLTVQQSVFLMSLAFQDSPELECPIPDWTTSDFVLYKHQICRPICDEH